MKVSSPGPAVPTSAVVPTRTAARGMSPRPEAVCALVVSLQSAWCGHAGRPRQGGRGNPSARRRRSGGATTERAESRSHATIGQAGKTGSNRPMKAPGGRVGQSWRTPSANASRSLETTTQPSPRRSGPRSIMHTFTAGPVVGPQDEYGDMSSGFDFGGGRVQQNLGISDLCGWALGSRRPPLGAHRGI